MPATTDITLSMLLDELERQRRYFKDHYPGLVKKGKITPYQRDHRISINNKLIDLVKQAIANKKTNGPKLLHLLNELPQ